MINYIYLDKSTNLQLLDKELYFVNQRFLSLNNDVLYNSTKEYCDLNFWSITKEYSAAYPRYDISDSIFKLTPQPNISLLVDVKSKTFNKTFADVTDQRSFDLLNFSKDYNNIYIFWSGGIDSTIILTSVLKNWSKEDLKKIVVILNEYSIEENENFYLKFIKNKLATCSTTLFFSGEVNFNNSSIYISGEAADALAGHQYLNKFEMMYPGLQLKPFKKHTSSIINFFARHHNLEYASYTFKKIVRSINYHNIEIDTVFDFFWWIAFNWCYEKHVYNIIWQCIPELDPSLNLEKFIKNNYFQWYNSEDYQYWAIQNKSNLINFVNDVKSNKFFQKKYIFDFDSNLDYFENKIKEASTPKNTMLSNHKVMCALDTDYNIYYRNDKDIKN
jgi:hypothetical protein